MSFRDFLTQAAATPLSLLLVLLTAAVIFVNGWTDAPNAIATCVCTGVLHRKTAVRLAAVFNLLGVVVMTAVNAGVANTVAGLVRFDAQPQRSAAALCAALGSVALWGVAAWRFGIPTSESHGLLAGLSGAAVAVSGSFSSLQAGQWAKVLFGLVFSVCCGFLSGGCLTRGSARLFRRGVPARAKRISHAAMIGGAAAMAFMHGAQDGQKFMGVLLLGLCYTSGSRLQALPLWLMVLCSLLMASGTAVGGKRIIDKLGELTSLRPAQGFFADFGAAATLLAASLLGLPVSTTHTKTAAMLGAGAASAGGAVNWRIARQMALAWLLTFPCCALLGYAATRLLLLC